MDKYGRGAERTDFPASDALKAAIGEVRDREEECPGVWYVSTYGGGERSGTEFYVVEKDADAIPDEAKAYGTAIPGVSGVSALSDGCGTADAPDNPI